MPDNRGESILPGDHVMSYGSRYIALATVLSQVTEDRYLIQLDGGTEALGPFEHPNPMAVAEMDQADAIVRDHVVELLGGDHVEPDDARQPFEVPGRLLMGLAPRATGDEG
jgi:hypothetical protein